MNLQQLYARANAKSYYSRSDDEVYNAINAASKKIYLWASREFRGYFFKNDTTKVVLVPNQEEYQLPPDCRTIIRIGEQLQNSPPNTPYRWMRPADINSQRFLRTEFESIYSGMSGFWGHFSFYGPYLKAADAEDGTPGQPGDQIRSIKVVPVPQETRVTSIDYAAVFIEILGPQSIVMMPMESHDAILDFAIAELVRANGDAMLAEQYQEAGKEKFQEDFLPWMRLNQLTQNPLTQEPYITELD